MCQTTQNPAVGESDHATEPSSTHCEALHIQKRNCPQDLEEGLKSTPKNVPVRFLYDDKGSDLYEQITQLEEYYPYMSETRILKTNASDIISNIPPESVIVELGCGDGSKTAILLNALAARDGPESVKFVGIDVSSGALDQAQRNLKTLCPTLPGSGQEFIAAEYFPGMREARKRHPDAMLCVLWLGSSVGNFKPKDAAEFLNQLRASVGSKSALLLCCDLWKDEATLHAAYDDSLGVTREFIINGMGHALRTLRHPDAAEKQESLWQYDAIVNPSTRAVEMWVTAKRTVSNLLPGIDIVKGERVLMEISRKFTEDDISALATASGYSLHAHWRCSRYSVQLLLPPLEALQRCWQDTDCLFDNIEDWTTQPIDLRHPFLFYYGHVAAFLKSKMIQQETPSPMDVLLSRGIDPNVLDPSQCHSHPEVPNVWPSRAEIETYVNQVRTEITALMEETSTTPEMHALLMSLEHERMHQETLCYMLAQHRKTQFVASKLLHVNGTSSDDEVAAATHRPFYAQCTYWKSVVNSGSETPFSSSPSDSPTKAGAEESVSRSVPDLPVVDGGGVATTTQFVDVPGGEVTLGMDLSEPHGFLWDNELGKKGPQHVAHMSVAALPVTVAEFRKFVVEDRGYERKELWDDAALTASGGFVSTGQAAPSTWTLTPQGDIYVHMPEGSYHWSEVAKCPVYVSLAEARAYAKLHSCRIMTEVEYTHIVNLQRTSTKPTAENTTAETTSISALESSGWEWTNTEFAPFEGFAADSMYPEYSVDFFDGQHFVLKGSCPYTHPSMRRRSFRNYYQYLYAHMFSKFRLVKEDC